MKLPPRVRKLARRALGSAAAEAISPEAMRDLAAREPVVVLHIGLVSGGAAADERLPGEQRSASLAGVIDSVRDVPLERPIIAHCG